MSSSLSRRFVLGAAVAILCAPAASAAEPNAALAYWKAFHFMPKLDRGEIQTLVEWKTAEVKDLKKIVGEGGAPTWQGFLFRAVKIKKCDWALDYDEDGIGLLLPHLDKGRMFSRLALARARCRFEEGDPGAGLEIALAAMTLARHLGGDELIISFLVQMSIEQDAIELIARHLPVLSERDRKRLTAALDALPEGGSLEKAVRVDKRTTVTWVGKWLEGMKDDRSDAWKAKVRQTLSYTRESERALDKLFDGPGDSVAKLIALNKALGGFHDELLKYVHKSPAKVAKPIADLVEEYCKDNPLGRFLLPQVNVALVWERAGAGATRIDMLRAAVAVADKGPDAVKQTSDRYAEGARPLGYRKAPGGFELTSQLKEKGKPVTLRVGVPPKG
jgi:hypothetical protein